MSAKGLGWMGLGCCALLALPVSGASPGGACRNLSVLRFSLQQSSEVDDLSAFEAYQKICLENVAIGFSLEELRGEVETGDTEGTLDATRVSVWLEEERPLPAKRWRCFASGGLGVSFVEIEGDSGLRDSEGEEVVAGLTLGVRYLPKPRWFMEAAFRGNFHLADWKLTDDVSGRSQRVEAYQAYGFSIGLGLVF